MKSRVKSIPAYLHNQLHLCFLKPASITSAAVCVFNQRWDSIGAVHSGRLVAQEEKHAVNYFKKWMWNSRASENWSERWVWTIKEFVKCWVCWFKESLINSACSFGRFPPEQTKRKHTAQKVRIGLNRLSADITNIFYCSK